jgi:origin recognition complex subunit 4
MKRHLYAHFLGRIVDGLKGSFNECFMRIFELMRQGDRQNIPVVVVLDEFDMFTTHPKQALLYNLFDVVQSSESAICVLGLTNRFDAVDDLEKRVKSRFSHRILFFSPPATVQDYVAIAQNALTVTAEDGLTDAQVAAFNDALQVSFVFLLGRMTL